MPVGFSYGKSSSCKKMLYINEKTFNIDTNIVVRHNPIKDSWNYSLYFKGEELMAVKTQAFRQFAVSGLT
mgnify:CR=1 FL=1